MSPVILSYLFLNRMDYYKKNKAVFDYLLCRQSKQTCCTTKHCTSHYWHSKWMKTQNSAKNPFSLIGNGTRAYKILYSMTISLLDN